MSYESVKVETSIVNKVRELKKTTGINIGPFFQKAAEEKIAGTFSESEMRRAIAAGLSIGYDSAYKGNSKKMVDKLMNDVFLKR